MDTVTSLNWLDIVLAIVIVVSAVAGLRAGFTRVVIGLLALIVGLMAGFWCYRLVGEWLHSWITSISVANAIGFFSDLSRRYAIGFDHRGHFVARPEMGWPFLVQLFAGRCGRVSHAARCLWPFWRTCWWHLPLRPCRTICGIREFCPTPTESPRYWPSSRRGNGRIRFRTKWKI